ncbi:MAG: ABC transporter ATP-binding protein [Haloarculaceae archaeon]
MIEAREVVVTYDGTRALDGVSLSVDDGEFLLLVGPNGSGKTTLVRTFNALEKPDDGAVRVDGVDASDSPVVARTNVGMVFQHPRDQFVAATVGADVAFGPENLGLDRAEIDRRVDEALAAVGLDGRRDDRIATLSGGEQARVAVAGALAMGADHLVLDEPLAGLDFPARRSVLDHLETLATAGTSLVVVTHDLRDVVDLADRVVALAGGRVAFDCPPGAALDRLADVDVRDPRC